MEVVVYTKPNCPQCVQVKNVLKSADISYTEKEISPDNIDMLMNYTRSAPAVFINDEFMDTKDVLNKSWEREKANVAIDLSGIVL
jgi:glutaredoxin